MSSRNIVVFGAPDIDRRPFLQLAGVPDAAVNAAPSPTNVFETRMHSVGIAQLLCNLYDTAGLPDLDPQVDARKALSTLHRFTHNLTTINLLVYVVREQPMERNYRLFYEYLCGSKIPIILFQTNSNTTTPINLKFSERFDSSKGTIQDAIRRKCKKNVERIQPKDLFIITALGSLRLLDKTSGWSLYECRDALKKTLMEEGSLSEDAAERECARAANLFKQKYFHNIIVFGSSGAGKTSTISMLTDKCPIPTNASSAGGSTFKSKGYSVNLGDYRCTLHDTIGLNDGASTSPQAALQNLFQLITKIEGGVSLLVYVHRGKIQPRDIEDYKLFNAVCENKVPIALVVTGLEDVDSMDDWWKENKILFQNANIQTEHVACITASKGKWMERLGMYRYQEEYDESSKRLKRMLLAAPLGILWKAKTLNWASTVLVEIYRMLAKKFDLPPLASNQWLVNSFVENLKISTNDATDLAGNLERVLRK